MKQMKPMTYKQNFFKEIQGDYDKFQNYEGESSSIKEEGKKKEIQGVSRRCGNPVQAQPQNCSFVKMLS